MKKNTLKVIALTAIMVLVTAFGVSTSTYRTNGAIEQATEENIVIPSQKQCAIATIQNHIGKTVNLAEDFAKISKSAVTYRLVTDEQKSDDYVFWSMYNPDTTNTKVFFMFNNDEDCIFTKNSSVDFISDKYVINAAYKNYCDNENSCVESYAWNYENYSKAIMGVTTQFICSSIWTYEESSNTISLVWWDDENPNWEDYQK